MHVVHVSRIHTYTLHGNVHNTYMHVTVAELYFTELKKFHWISTQSSNLTTYWTTSFAIIHRTPNDANYLASDTKSLHMRYHICYCYLLSHNTLHKTWHHSARFQNRSPTFCQIWIIFTHLKLWIASARHNFKWEKKQFKQLGGKW